MPLTPEQIADRVNFIGGSDSAAVLGLSRWSTPLQVWAEKTGAVKPEDISDQLPVKVGTELEALVIKLFCDETGKKVSPETPETQVHPLYPFIRATPDALMLDEDAGLEAKTAIGYKEKEWQNNEAPSEYKVQCLHNMWVTGKKYWYLACLIGGNQKFVWTRVDRDEKIIAQMEERIVEFWTKFIEPRVMPQIPHRNDDDILFKMFPDGSDPKSIALDDNANRLAESIQALQLDNKVTEGFIAKEKNALKLLLKDHSVGETDHYKITWKRQNTRRFDVNEAKVEDWEYYDKFCKDSPSRVFRILRKKIKEAGT